MNCGTVYFIDGLEINVIIFAVLFSIEIVRLSDDVHVDDNLCTQAIYQLSFNYRGRESPTDVHIHLSLHRAVIGQYEFR